LGTPLASLLAPIYVAQHLCMLMRYSLTPPLVRRTGCHRRAVAL